jgi:transcription elongation factor GreA
MTEHTTWLTQDAFDRLQAELDERAGERRTEIVKRIELARQEGDLSENAGYHAAREAQGMNEARIRHLTHFLEHVQIGAPEVEDGVVSVGRTVSVEFNGGDQEDFLLGLRVEEAPEGVEVLSPSSPLGAALIGKRVGDDVTYSTANGRSITVTIADVR